MIYPTDNVVNEILLCIDDLTVGVLYCIYSPLAKKQMKTIYMYIL
jgi:hypothetical protein